MDARTSPRFNPGASRWTRSGGFALAVALIFLVVLTLIAVAATRATGFGARMSANNAIANEALSVSESARNIADQLVEGNAYYGGWPCTAMGGCSGTVPLYAIPDGEWSPTWPTGMTILRTGQNLCTDAANSNAFKMWFNSNDESSFCPVWYADDSTHGLQDDACYNRNVATSGNTTYTAAASISVYKIRTDAATGAGGAMISGYLGEGAGVASGGGYIYFFTQTEGKDNSAIGQSQTSSVYRYLIRN